MSTSGDWRPRAPRPGYEKTTISIELKYHSTQNASYRIKRGFIHILSGHVLELIATGIFYGFLNIYKILRLLREQNIVRFQRPKITSDTWFLTEKDIPRWKAISKLSKYTFKTLGNIWNEFLAFSRDTWRFERAGISLFHCGNEVKQGHKVQTNKL